MGVVLGTGLHGLAALVEDGDVPAVTIQYNDIPHVADTTAPTHEGKLILGQIGGVPVVVMQGRLHYYEGYDLAAITLPVRIMQQLGIQTLLLSNAAGGLTEGLSLSDLCLITDHINLIPGSPLRGEEAAAFGSRFVDLFEAYCPQLRLRAQAAAQTHNLPLQTGIYAAVSGPHLETPAEYAYLRKIGANIVGMSTAPEVIVARQMGVRCAAISVITDLCYGTPTPLHIPAVFAAIEQAEPSLTTLLKNLIADPLCH